MADEKKKGNKFPYQVNEKKKKINKHFLIFIIFTIFMGQ
jgi:hypothetical protein